jgi:pyruvate dehydrogenase E2 component (dihydrolipoamide acetyltransferase)
VPIARRAGVGGVTALDPAGSGGRSSSTGASPQPDGARVKAARGELVHHALRSRGGRMDRTKFRTDENVSGWRKVAMATWRRASDASIYGWIDVDATELVAYVEALRAATGVRVTPTHVVGKAAAIAFAENPAANAVLSLGRLRRRESVDVFFSVAVGDEKSVAGAKVTRADSRSIPEIAERLESQVSRIRKDGDTDLQRSQSMLKRLPVPALGAILETVSALTFDLGLDLRRLGVPSDPFGTVIVTNVGVLGVDRGLAPLIPHGRTAALLTVGKIHDEVVPAGGRPAVRPVLTLGGTFDHRVVDGLELGRISVRLREILADPAKHLGAPALAAPVASGSARVP